METYKNSYSVNEDEVLWELHEIRHKLHKELQTTPLSEFNKNAMDFFEQWKKEKAQTMRVENLRGRATVKMTTDEIMALTRGEE